MALTVTVPSPHRVTWWENIINTCGNMFLFVASRNDLSDWLAATKPDNSGEALAIERTPHVAQPANELMLNFDHERPLGDDMSHHSNKIGLSGPFWEFQAVD